MNYSYHPDARREAAGIVARYADIAEDLGSDFLAELEDAVERVVHRPEAWAKHIAGAAYSIASRTEWFIELRKEIFRSLR